MAGEQDAAREAAYQAWKQHHQIGTADAHAEPLYRTIWDSSWAAGVAHGRAKPETTIRIALEMFEPHATEWETPGWLDEIMDDLRRVLGS